MRLDLGLASSPGLAAVELTELHSSGPRFFIESAPVRAHLLTGAFLLLPLAASAIVGFQVPPAFVTEAELTPIPAGATTEPLDLHLCIVNLVPSQNYATATITLVRHFRTDFLSLPVTHKTTITALENGELVRKWTENRPKRRFPFFLAPSRARLSSSRPLKSRTAMH
jgi:hypothetical protein